MSLSSENKAGIFWHSECLMLRVIWMKKGKGCTWLEGFYVVLSNFKTAYFWMYMMWMSWDDEFDITLILINMALYYCTLVYLLMYLTCVTVLDINFRNPFRRRQITSGPFIFLYISHQIQIHTTWKTENYTTSGAPVAISVPIVYLVVGKTLLHKGIVIVWWITLLNAFVNKPYNEKTWLSAGARHLLFDKHFS